VDSRHLHGAGRDHACPLVRSGARRPRFDPAECRPVRLRGRRIPRL